MFPNVCVMKCARCILMWSVSWLVILSMFLMQGLWTISFSSHMVFSVAAPFQSCTGLRTD